MRIEQRISKATAIDHDEHADSLKNSIDFPDCLADVLPMMSTVLCIDQSKLALTMHYVRKVGARVFFRIVRLFSWID